MPVAQMRQLVSEHKPKLLAQVRTTFRRKHYSIRTEDSYVDGIKRAPSKDRTG